MTDEAEVAPEAVGLFIQSSVKRNPQGDCILPEKSCGKYAHLSVTRVSCIIVIVLCVNDRSWLEYNTLFFQNWVMQYMWLVCGVCYGLSSRPVLQYLGRLLLYFFVGVAAVWTACRIKKVNGLPIGGNMWFVLILAVFSFLLMPLKKRVANMKENPHALLAGSRRGSCSRGPEEPLSNTSSGSRDSLLHGIAWICGGLAVLLLISSLVILPLGVLCTQTWEHAKEGSHDQRATLRFVMHLCAEVQACLSAVWILWSFPHVFSDQSAVAWLLVINMYTFKLVCGYGELAIFSSGFQLLLIGLTAGDLGLSRRQWASTLFQRYWMVVAFIGSWCFLPGTHGMLMLVEPGDFLERQRFILLEALLVVGWLVAGADMVDPKIFDADDLTWLSDWASLLFLSYQAVLIIAPDNVWLVFIGMMPVVLVFRKIAGLSSTKSDQGNV